MSLLTRPDELNTPAAIIGMIYGQPGSRKTTTALSAPTPVLLDFDQGLHRVDPKYRVPSLQVENYQQVLDLIEGGELAPFETIVVDTGGKLIDRIIEYVIRKNPKDGNGRGAPSQQGWGTVKNEFSTLVKRLRALNKNIIFVAHESEEKNGEDTIKRPDIAGSARKDVVKEIDFMGYMELRGSTPVINFNPTDKFYAKNSLGLDAAVEVPTLKEGEPNNFLSRYIFKASADKLAADTALRKEYEDLLAEINAAIAKLKTPEDVNAFYLDVMPPFREIWDSKHYMRNALKDHISGINIVFDGTTKTFIAKPKEKKAKADASEQKEAVASASATTDASAGDGLSDA